MEGNLPQLHTTSPKPPLAGLTREGDRRTTRAAERAAGDDGVRRGGRHYERALQVLDDGAAGDERVAISDGAGDAQVEAPADSQANTTRHSWCAEPRR